ncbi:MAG: hypothetical protein JW954_08495 [Dehalococcoidaceae bacterium]|nr:hypothetical protein [Dehalococcoidaceae bacterium]
MTKRSRKLLTTYAVLAGVIACLVSCSAERTQLPAFGSPPQIYDLDQLLAEYEADPVGAGKKHEGQVYFFPSVVAEKVVSTYSHPMVALDTGDLYVSSGQVYFRAQNTYDLDKLADGFVLDILGEVGGWVQSRFYIYKCTFSVIKGGDLPPPGGY